MIIPYIADKVMKPIRKVSRLYKLLTVLDKLDISVVEDTMYIKMDSTLVLNNNKDILIYSANGKLITSHSRTHINPDIKINILDICTDKIDRDSIARGELIGKQKIFARLLKENKIKSI